MWSVKNIVQQEHMLMEVDNRHTAKMLGISIGFGDILGKVLGLVVRNNRLHCGLAYFESMIQFALLQHVAAIF